MRQPRSVPAGVIAPARIPLIPAILPSDSISKVAARPIMPPPIRAERGVKDVSGAIENSVGSSHWVYRPNGCQ
ncbi:hypothetical protein GCM10007148_17350 [Parvularcula lutaonensis]|nr:hypothetical protein GCM10007148_17350 [Parvularcula lutaonensis]